MDLPVPLTLRTPRLLLRPWRGADAPALLPILESNAAHLTPWIPARVATAVPLPELSARLDQFAADFMAGIAWRYALWAPDETQLLGEVDLFPRAAEGRVPFPEADRLEIGYWLARSVTGRGLATEAAGALLDVATSMPAMTHVEIRCDPANAPSAAVPRRLGFHLAGVEGEGMAESDDDISVWRRVLRAPATGRPA